MPRRAKLMVLGRRQPANRRPSFDPLDAARASPCETRGGADQTVAYTGRRRCTLTAAPGRRKDRRI